VAVRGAKKRGGGRGMRMANSIDRFIGSESRERERDSSHVFSITQWRVPFSAPFSTSTADKSSLPYHVLYCTTLTLSNIAKRGNLGGRLQVSLILFLSSRFPFSLSLPSNLFALSVSITREEEEEGVSERNTRSVKTAPSLERRSRCRDVVILPADDEAIMNFELRKVERRKENVCANSGSRDATSLSTL